MIVSRVIEHFRKMDRARNNSPFQVNDRVHLTYLNTWYGTVVEVRGKNEDTWVEVDWGDRPKNNTAALPGRWQLCRWLVLVNSKQN